MRRVEIVTHSTFFLLLATVLFVIVFQTPQVGVLVGPSMKPTISDGDIAVYQPNEEASVGDIIIFRSSEHNGSLVGHRVVKKNETHYVTKGDNNIYRDKPIRIDSDKYKGRLVYHIHIPFGFPIDQETFLKNKYL